jgi:putative nucleotidyltransferase with HDIG domain
MHSLWRASARRPCGGFRRSRRHIVAAAAPEIHGSGADSDKPVWGVEHLSRARVARYLLLSLLMTIAVLVLPAMLAATLIPPRGAPSTFASGALTVAMSLWIARLGAVAWQGRSRGSDLVFADLMAWGLARRWWVERRLSRLSTAYERAACANGTVRVEMLEAIALLLEARSPYTYGHCRRVARHAERIASAMHLTPAEIATIRTAALLHDVGKIYTPPELLHKAEPLTEEEAEIVGRHSADGARMLGPVNDASLATIVLHHHERVGGGGYPECLLGEEIPLGARIVAVASTFDMLISGRPGRPGRPARNQREALAALQAQAGSALDRRVVDTFVECCSARRSVLSLAFLTAVSERVTGALQFPGGLGLTGTSTTAQVLPALGAAGLLALAPAIQNAPPANPPSPTPHSRSAELRLASSITGSSTTQVSDQRSQGTQPNPIPDQRGGGGRHSSSASPTGSTPEGSATPNSGGRLPGETQQNGPSASTTAQSASTTTTTSSTSQPSSPPPTREESSGQPAEAEPPPQQAPAITTPTVSTSAISTPAISLPPVNLPPPVSVPAITVPSVTVPSLTLPGLKLPLGR